jgi:NTP pyrophosphatase (non-canonical NTP hydrolase)
MTFNDKACNTNCGELIESITRWHYDRNLIDGSTHKDQYCKLISEAGELADAIAKKQDIRDHVGDMIVVLVNLAERGGWSIQQCLEHAWNEIKDRKGRMVDGVFVKEQDL